MNPVKGLALKLLLCLVLLSSGRSDAYFPNAAFWKKRLSFSLKYTTTPQTILSGNCSAVVTVRTYNAANVITNVTSNLTVDLSATGSTTFFSDSNCTTPITSLTIPTGSSTGNFYFVTTTTGSFSLISSATGYQNASQVQTINTNPYIWTGAGGNANWATNANWSGGTAPGAGHAALFNGSCSSNCSPTISSNVSISNVRIEAGYSGTITQAPGATITLTSNWIQRSGTFIGGNSNLSVYGIFVENGSFTLPQSTLQVTSDLTFKASASITATGSTLLLTCEHSKTCTISTGAANLNHLSFQGYYSHYNLGSSTITVTGNLSLGDTYPSETDQRINSGTINVSGNVSVINSGYRGNAQIVLTGNASGQTITGIVERYMPSLKIATGTNPVTLVGDLYISNGYELASSGTLNLAGSSITVFCPYGTVCSTVPGSITYNNFSFIGYYGTHNLGGATLKVGGTFSGGDTYGPGYFEQQINNGTVLAYGDVKVINYGYQGTASVVVAGNPAGQTITGNGFAFSLPNLTITAGTNPVALSGTVASFPSFTMNSVGTFTTTGSTLAVTCSHSVTCSITPGTVTYNNVLLQGNYSIYTLNGGTMTIAGNLSIGDRFSPGYLDQPVNNGTFAVNGNLSIINNGNVGSATIAMNGNASGQTITSVAGKKSPNIRISSGANNVSLTSALNVSGNLQVSSGTMNMAGNSMNVTSALTISSGATLTRGGGALTYGSLSNSGTLNP